LPWSLGVAYDVDEFRINFVVSERGKFSRAQTAQEASQLSLVESTVRGFRAVKWNQITCTIGTKWREVANNTRWKWPRIRD